MSISAGVDLAAAARPGATLTPLGACRYALQGGLEVLVVSRQNELGAALARLRREAMAVASGSGAIAIDLEWRPDFRPDSDNTVALVQLAAGTLCVLVRTCHVGFPGELQSFLRDPAWVFVGVNWRTADAAKMWSSFGWETRNFGRFVDVVDAASRAGVNLGGRPGLAGLAEAILGVVLHKSKTVTLSDWAAPVLSHDHIRYAALDAALVWYIYQEL
ncbi:hypothetical protein ABPG77_009294 [Micractinium sp. CCAP 211/92]